MAASKEKSTLALQALGYHGTTLEAAQKIVTGGSLPSSNPWEWLRHGIYFWQDAPNRARDWTKEWHASKGYDGPIAVVARKSTFTTYHTRLQADGRNVRRRVSQTGHTAGSSQVPWRPTTRGAEPGLILYQKPLARYRHTIAPSKIKKPHNHAPPRSMTRSFARKRASWEWSEVQFVECR